MALIHYLYTGHFVPEGGLVRMQDHRPFTTRPINMDAVAVLLKKYSGAGTDLQTPPPEWGMSIRADYIVCYVCSPPPALLFIADYAQQEGAVIVDMGAFSVMAPELVR